MTFPLPHGVPGGTTVLVELTPDIHICGICKQQFNNLDAFVAHKQSGCQLTSTSGATPSTVQFVSEETVPATQTQTTTRTITSETQTITGKNGGCGSHLELAWLCPNASAELVKSIDTQGPPLGLLIHYF